MKANKISKSALPEEVNIESTTKSDYVGLLSGHGKFSNSPFTSLNFYDIFLVSMSIGVIRGKRKPLSNKLSFIKSQMFKNSYGEALIKALAVYETNSTSIIEDQEKMFSIAEEYANGGLELLVEQIVTGSESIAQEIEEKWKIYISDTIQLIKSLTGNN